MWWSIRVAVTSMLSLIPGKSSRRHCAEYSLSRMTLTPEVRHSLGCGVRSVGCGMWGVNWGWGWVGGGGGADEPPVMPAAEPNYVKRDEGDKGKEKAGASAAVAGMARGMDRADKILEGIEAD